MTFLDWPTFVLQRRINRPPDDVLRTIANPAVFGPNCVWSNDRDGALRLDGSFRHLTTYRRSAWRADATLLDARGRPISAVQIEVGPWSDVDTELLLRPRARRPDRWSGRRLRRYFAQAHRSADDLTHLLQVAPTSLRSLTTT